MMYTKQQLNRLEDGYLPFIKREETDFDYADNEFRRAIGDSKSITNTSTPSTTSNTGKTSTPVIITTNNGLFDRMYAMYNEKNSNNNSSTNNNNNNNNNTLTVPPSSNTSSTPGSAILPLNETPLMTPPINLINGLTTNSLFGDTSPNMLGSPRTGNVPHPVELTGNVKYPTNIPEMAKPIYEDYDDLGEDPMSWVPLFDGGIKREDDENINENESLYNDTISTTNTTTTTNAMFMLQNENTQLRNVFNEPNESTTYPLFVSRHSAPDILKASSSSSSSTSPVPPHSNSYSGPSRSSNQQLSKKDLKRIKNTIAARNSRKRKADKMSKLEDRVQQLETENRKLREHIGDLVRLLSQDKNQTV